MDKNSVSPIVLGALHITKAMSSGSFPHTVYVIAVNNEFVKIGFTAYKDARGRIAEIQKGCPYLFEVVLQLNGGKPLEQALHAIFASYRHRDEWFRYEGDLREFCAHILRTKGTGRLLPGPDVDASPAIDQGVEVQFTPAVP